MLKFKWRKKVLQAIKVKKATKQHKHENREPPAWRSTNFQKNAPTFSENQICRYWVQAFGRWNGYGRPKALTESHDFNGFRI